MKTIPLRGKNGEGKQIIIDDDLYPILITHKIYVTGRKIGNKEYFRPTITINGKKQYLYHYIMNTCERIDHINRDILDNRRSNLRICTQAQNCQNRSKKITGKNPFKGVFFCSGRNRPWVSKIHNCHISYSLTPEEAAYIYDQASLQIDGDFSQTNFAYD